ncbi:GNAT family N-acetyltransferase [Seonamhaeicola algicola]|uniref:GNAT family N-acetyltransferase n=1 Tax=Seonamhaeicola algicola TaxID=1719036 RepID=UPI001FE68F44|nr:GNAT family N-acetyltransferase [Seonamhaeicola algicola]
MQTNITYTRASTKNELLQILELQKANLITNVSETVKQKEGFVTVHHSFEILQTMNTVCPHIIAKHKNNVVGYALTMVKDFKNDIDILKPMFNHIETTVNANLNYIVMGQICIDKNFRGQGVFKGLYNHMTHTLKNQFSCIITLIDSKNIRSINAHKAVGFKTLKTFSQDEKNLNLVILNF